MNTTERNNKAIVWCWTKSRSMGNSVTVDSVLVKDKQVFHDKKCFQWTYVYITEIAVLFTTINWVLVIIIIHS